MRNQLRILVISLVYSPPSSGGYEVMCANICEWLKGRGHDVLVLTSVPFDGSDLSEYSSTASTVPVRHVLRCYWNGSECLYPSLLDALTIEQANQTQLQAVLKEYQPDVISFWHMGDMSLGLITTTAQQGFPIVFVIGDDWLCYGWWADGWIRRFRQHPEHADAVERQTGIPTRLPNLGMLGAFCFVSDYTKRRAEEVGKWKFSRFDITFPGVSASEFPPLDQVATRSWQWRLLWIGRVVEEKGVVTAIKALSWLPDEAVLEIVGPVDPIYRTQLEKLAPYAGTLSRLSFSVASREEIGLRYRQADVTLFTSEIVHEAFGLVPLEAMASGCPVVSTCIGGSAEYCIDEVNCLRIPPGDAEALALAIQRLAATPALRRQLIDNGLHTARELTLERQGERIEHMLFAAGTQ